MYQFAPPLLASFPLSSLAPSASSPFSVSALHLLSSLFFLLLGSVVLFRFAFCSAVVILISFSWTCAVFRSGN